MADPIRKIKRMEVSEEEIKEKNASDVLDAISENKESVLKGIDLLATIDDAGGLEIMSALVKHREVALEKFIEEINKDRYAGSLENLSKLFILMGSIEVEELEPVITKINTGIKDAQTVSEDESTSYFDLLRALKDPEINRSITMLLEFLRVVGKE